MTAQRLQFLITACVILAGIGLTGFKEVHWLLYVPVAGLGFAGLTGICPSVTFFKKCGLK